jgi:hypothetical protein
MRDHAAAHSTDEEGDVDAGPKPVGMEKPCLNIGIGRIGEVDRNNHR